MQDLEHQRLGPVLLERPAAGRHLVEHRAERVDVRPRVSRLAADRFGRHVGHGAQDHPGLRQVRHAVGRVQQTGESEVEDLGSSGRRQHDVAGLQVAMQHATAMRVFQGIADLRSNPRHHVELERASLEERLEGPARDVFHDEEVQVVLGVEVEDRGDPGVGQARENVRLAAKSLARDRICQRAPQEHLDRHVAVEMLVVGAIDLAHAARAEGFEDSIVGEGLADHGASLERSKETSIAKSGVCELGARG